MILWKNYVAYFVLFYQNCVFTSTLIIGDGGYSTWGPYGDCSKSCGGGKQTRRRTCTNPPPSAGGKNCSGLGPSSSSRECNNQDCPGELQNKFLFVTMNNSSITVNLTLRDRSNLQIRSKGLWAQNRACR